MNSAKSTSIGLVIPVLNAEPYPDSLLPALQQQSLQPDRFLVMVSQSDDASAERFRAAGAEIVTAERCEFYHGGTRQRVAEIHSDCDVLIYLMQDAIPASNESFARRVAAFDDPAIGVAYGKQLPRQNTTPISTHARRLNYPPTSCSMTFEHRYTLGFKTCFCSDSFTPHQCTALAQVGGFPNAAPVGEDVPVTAMMRREKWTKRYVAKAEVYHSHSYSKLVEFRRAFDIGAFHSSAQWLGESFCGAGGEGRKFVVSLLRYLADPAPSKIGSALIRTGGSGNQVGIRSG